MQSLTEIVATVVMHSTAAAYSHFGVVIEPQQLERPAAVERKVARTRPAPMVHGVATTGARCPDSAPTSFVARV